jgi:hypothetical protein
MVNGWLKSRLRPWTAADGCRRRQNERIFATKTALTSSNQPGVRRSEVVLGQTILGLLINRMAAFAAGIKK